MEGYCEHHNPLDLGYVQWHTEATKRCSQRFTQVKCKKCKRWLFPDELNEPDNIRSQEIIENYKRYLEQHPRAKPIVVL